MKVVSPPRGHQGLGLELATVLHVIHTRTVTLGLLSFCSALCHSVRSHNENGAAVLGGTEGGREAGGGEGEIRGQRRMIS